MADGSSQGPGPAAAAVPAASAVPAVGADRRRGGHRLNTRRPLVALALAGLVAVALAGFASATEPASSSETGAESAAAAPTATTAAPCTEIRDSLRPDGPLPAPGALLAEGALPPGSALAEIVARGRLVVGVDQRKYLIGYRNPQTGALEGSDIDVVRLIAQALFGSPDRVQYIVLDVADRVPAIQEKRVDLVVNSFAVTCERQRSVEFSAPYIRASARLLVPVGSGVEEVDDLDGGTVCTSRGSTTEAVLKQLPLELEVLTRANLADCMVDLHQGRAGAVASDEVLLAGLAAQDPQTVVVGPSLLATDYAVGANPDSPDLVRFVNAVLEQARTDGTLAASIQRWLAGAVEPLPEPPAPAYRD